MARDTGSYTLSNPPVVDPAKVLTISSGTTDGATTLTYTTSAAHNLTLGAPVIIYGTGTKAFNFNPDGSLYGGVTSTTAIGWGTPAIVSSVVSSTQFKVKAPGTVASGSVSSGTVINDSLVSESPYGSSSKQQSWLPTTSQTNVVVAREWGNSFPIQNNEDRTAGTALATSAPSGNGTQVTYTVSSHSFLPGQVVSIQGVVPEAFNLEGVTIAATTSTTIVVNSTITGTATSYTSGTIVPVGRLGGLKQATITAGTGATQQATVTPSLTATAASGAVTLALATTSVVVGAAVSATAVSGIAPGTVVTAIGTGSVTINPATTSSVASASVITIAGTRKATYQTRLPHNLQSGQPVVVTGSSNINYNTTDAVATVIDAKTFSVSAPVARITAIATTGSSVTVTTDVSHGVTTSDYINVAGVTGGTVTNINTTSTQPSAVTTNTITYTASSPVLTGATSLGSLVKSSGAFSGTAYVGGADNGWSGTYVYPSGNLVAALDNHDRVTNSDSGYPEFAPTYNTPNVIGLTTSYAIQKIRAAGQTPGFVQFSSDITATTVATTATTLQVTSGTAHNLSVGDTVELKGSSNTTLNIGDAVVSSVPSTLSFIVTASGCTGTVGATALKFRPKNTVVSAQSPSAGATTATVVGFTRNYGI